MSILPVYVGLDYHLATIQVCVMDPDRKILANVSVGNSPEAVRKVVAPHGNKVSVAIEAATGAAEFAELLITQYGWHVELAHPGYANRMKQTPDKSDWTDAKLLADLTRVGYIPRVWLAPKYIRDLRELVSYRFALVQQCTATKLRLRALLRKHRIDCPYSPWTIKGKAWLLNEANLPSLNVFFELKGYYGLIGYLHEMINEAQKKLESDTAEDLVIKQLMEQPGIGFITAVTMRAKIGHFDRFRSGKQLAHFCAICPRNNSSAGKTTTGGLIKAGDEQLRQVIIEAAHRLMRYDPHWKEMAARLRAEGKKTCVIVAAIGNRWIRKLFHQMVECKSQPA